MGNTTIIELNHDIWDEIANNRDEFVDSILEQLSSGKLRTHHRLPGGRVIAFFPRYSFDETCQKWDAFKKSLASSGKEEK